LDIKEMRKNLKCINSHIHKKKPADAGFES
jgi:hypothetical protein